MDIQIEIIVILVLIFVFVFWWLWFKLTNFINKRRYKPENDKARKGEERRIAEINAGKQRLDKQDSIIPGPSEPEGRSSLPPTSIDSAGETSSGIRESRKIFRNPFKRRAR